MRGLYENSTDLAYSPFDKEDLLEVARALNVNNLNVVTTATLSPERTLFHSCLNGVQSYIRLTNFGETERGEEIAELSQQIYDASLKSFNDTLEHSQDDLQQKYQTLHDFVEALDASQLGKKWDEAAFQKEWPVSEQSYRWQSKAIETYQAVKNNIASGVYSSRNGWDAKRVTQYWGERNLEYKHYRWISRQLVEDYINKHFANQLLTKHPSEDREIGYIFGPMGSGKSQMTADYLWALPEEDRHDIILHDADYLKPALGKTAIQDGKIKATSGAEVQNESSIALYEGTRKRHFFASRREHAPNVLLNSIAANPLELEEGLIGGGKVKACLISMAPEDAWHSVCKRGETLNRLPAREDVIWSTKGAVDSLLNITSIAKAPITTQIYDRAYGQPPELVATLDSNTQTLHTNDAKRLAAVLERSSKDLKDFVCEMQSQGWGFEFTHASASATLTADGVWTQTGRGGFSDGLDAFKSLATTQRVGERKIPSQQSNCRGN